MTTIDAEPEALFTVGHRTVTRVAGPLIVVDGMDGVGYGELVEVETGDGPVREGQVLELDGSTGRSSRSSVEPSASAAAKPPY